MFVFDLQTKYLVIKLRIWQILVLSIAYSTINVVWPTLKQLITRSKMSKFYSNIKLGVPDDPQNCPLLLFFSYDQNLMTAENF